MADFLISYKRTHQLEGGYANHPSDRGGETYRGISRVNHPTWKGWKIIDELKKGANFPAILETRADLQELVLEFYKATFFAPLKLHMVNNQDLANDLYDMGVLMGTGTAAKFLQRTLNLTNKRQKLYKDLVVDGQIGSKTLDALNKHTDIELVRKVLNAYKAWRFIELAEKVESQEDFIHGWFNNRIN